MDHEMNIRKMNNNDCLVSKALDAVRQRILNLPQVNHRAK